MKELGTSEVYIATVECGKNIGVSGMVRTRVVRYERMRIMKKKGNLGIQEGPFPRSLVPLFQSASKCETILMKMTLICMKIKLHAELIFVCKVSHLDSFTLCNRGTRELGSGQMNNLKLQ